MPRIKAKKREYAVKDFRLWLKAEMVMKEVRQEDLAKWLSMSQPSVSYKISNCAFDLKELLIIFEKLDTPVDKIGQLLKP